MKSIRWIIDDVYKTMYLKGLREINSQVHINIRAGVNREMSNNIKFKTDEIIDRISDEIE